MMPKKLKALVSMFLCVMCLLLSTAVCGAVSQAYTIGEIDDMSITLPDGMSAVTRKSESSDQYFSLFGLDYDTTMKNFENGDIYLQGMNEASTITITVTMTKNEDSETIKNYNLLDKDKLTEVMGNFLTQTEYSSCTPDQSSDGQIVWMIFNTNVTTDTDAIKAYQAHTVYDGMSVNVTLQRNGSNVTGDDYSVFSGIVSSVSFGKTNQSSGIIAVVIIAAALIVIVLLLVLIIKLRNSIRANKRSKAESNNERVLKELADKYSLNYEEGVQADGEDEYSDDFVDIGSRSEDEYDSRYILDEEYERQLEDNIKEDYFDGVSNKPDSEIAENRYASDEEIDEILSNAHSFDDSVAREVYRDNKPESSEREQAEEYAEEAETDTSYESEEPAQSDNAYNDDEGEELDLTEDGLTEIDEYNNDEVLVREDSNQSKFESSYDFFEEAPKKKMGIISNKDIDDAEDYDVISEIEEHAERVSREEPQQPSFGEKVIAGAKSFGGGVKSFGVHCGYFCTNVYRMIKRKRAIAKRKKAEKERIERARARAERQRQQRRASENGGLVKVHSRTDRRPVQGSTQNRSRRPSTPQTRRNQSPSQSSRKR